MWGTDSQRGDYPPLTREQAIALLDGTIYRNRIAEYRSRGMTREMATEWADRDFVGFCPAGAMHVLDPETLAELGLG